MQGWLKLSRAIDALNQKVGQLMFWFTIAMICLGAYNALARYISSYVGRNLSSNAYLEGQWYLFGSIFMLAAAYGLRHNAHVRVDIFYAKLSTRGKAWVDFLGTVLFLLPFCTMTLWLSLPWVEFSWKIHEMSGDPGGLARYPIKTVVPVALMLLILQGISQAIKALAVIRGVRDSMDPAEETTGL